jgi:uronate dehydrogenase
VKTILITGAAGKMGRCITEGLRAAGYNVRATSRTPNEELGIKKLDIRDAQACMEALQGVDTVIHMGFFMRSNQFREEHVPTNIVGTWNLYEAAAHNGVRRVIFGSSNHAVGFYRRDDDMRDDIMHRPDSPYGLSKCFCELCGRYYSDRFGLSVINVRIGSYPHSEDGLPYSRRRCRTWLSRRDCKQLFQKCVEADEAIRFLTIYGVSGNTGGDFDISRLGEQIGYYPEDDGMKHLVYALEVDRFGGRDDLEFLGAENVLYSPLSAELEWNLLPEIQNRHAKEDTK